MSNKPDHVEVTREAHARWNLKQIAAVNEDLNRKYGTENVDRWVKEYYEQQCSYVIFTVQKDIYELKSKPCVNHKWVHECHNCYTCSVCGEQKD